MLCSDFGTTQTMKRGSPSSHHHWSPRSRRSESIPFSKFSLSLPPPWDPYRFLCCTTVTCSRIAIYTSSFFICLLSSKSLCNLHLIMLLSILQPKNAHSIRREVCLMHVSLVSRIAHSKHPTFRECQLWHKLSADEPSRGLLGLQTGSEQPQLSLCELCRGKM